MISPHANGFKKYNADGIGSRHDFTQGRFRCAQSTLGYQKYNTDGVGSCAPFPPTNKTIHAIHPNGIRRPCTICPNETNHPLVIRPNETVGAAPVCPPERPHSGVSIPKIHALCAGNLTMDAPLWGDTGGHTGTAPTKLRYTFARNPPPTTSTTQMRRVNNLHTHRGRKCIAHSRPHYLK